MSHLRVYHADDPEHALHDTNDQASIRGILEPAGVRFEQWEASRAVAPGASQDEVITAYRTDIDQLCADEGYQTVDVISLDADNPKKDELRQKFLFEHTHSEDEVRFFVAGSGLFTMHIDGKVYEVLCTQGDLISVPAGTHHWFDMGPNPHFVCIRFFDNQEGWVAQATGSEIAARFHRLEN